MPLPHHQSGKDKDGEEDISYCRSIVRNLFKWAIDVTDYRNSKDDMDPPKDCSLRSIADHSNLLNQIESAISNP